MYRSKNHIFINADVNGAANILRKVIPKAFRQWYSGCVFPASSGQCALALTLKPVTLVMGGSFRI